MSKCGAGPETPEIRSNVSFEEKVGWEITWMEPLSNPLENLHSLITGQISSFKILRENVKCEGTSKIY